MGQHAGIVQITTSIRVDQPHRNGGSKCQNDLTPTPFQKLRVANSRVGQHAGIMQIKLQVPRWVNITRMVGQHETEWWVNMVRNLQFPMK